ncbi:MAG: Na+/H+ antiporter, partial [Alphaproteobacteria bacterium]
MTLVSTLVSLMLLSVALGWLALRLRVPYPMVLVIGGLVVSLVPGLPRPDLDPAVVLVIFLPPILYQAALMTSIREFRANIRPISLLAIGLVIATTLAVGAGAHLLLGLPWFVCLLIGAIISPPDAVAATAVLSRMRMPRRIVAILEGESLINDASGLVIYKLLVVAVLAGSFSLVEAGFEFVTVAALGILIGLVAGWLSLWLHVRLKDPMLEVTLSLVLPFAIYVAAELVHGSGVLAVVAAGLLRSWYSPEAFQPMARILALGTWNVVVFVLNALVFVLIGLEIGGGMGSGLAEFSHLIDEGLLLTLVAMIVRFVWVFGITGVQRLLPGQREPMPPWRWLFVISFCSMRGIVSLAAALALPPEVAGRSEVIVLVFVVIVVTLLSQGLSLPWLIRRLGIGEDVDLATEEHTARVKTAFAGWQAVEAEA